MFIIFYFSPAFIVRNLRNSNWQLLLQVAAAHCKRRRNFIFWQLDITEVANMVKAGSLWNSAWRFGLCFQHEILFAHPLIHINLSIS